MVREKFKLTDCIELRGKLCVLCVLHVRHVPIHYQSFSRRKVFPDFHDLPDYICILHTYIGATCHLPPAYFKRPNLKHLATSPSTPCMLDYLTAIYAILHVITVLTSLTIDLAAVTSMLLPSSIK